MSFFHSKRIEFLIHYYIMKISSSLLWGGTESEYKYFKIHKHNVKDIFLHSLHSCVNKADLDDNAYRKV